MVLSLSPSVSVPLTRICPNLEAALAGQVELPALLEVPRVSQAVGQAGRAGLAAEVAA
jgi:hypothetical protein